MHVYIFNTYTHTHTHTPQDTVPRTRQPWEKSEEENEGDNSQEGPIETLQVDAASVDAARLVSLQNAGVFGRWKGQMGERGGREGGRRTSVSTKALAEMCSWVGVGVAMVLVVIEWRRRRRVGGDMAREYTAM
jgi:hypothetical protein